MYTPKIKVKTINLSNFRMNDLIECYKDNDFSVAQYICIVNVHSTVTSDENIALRDAINEAWISLADGKPISVVANILGCRPKMSRITGPDLMLEILKISEENSWRHYFYGSTPEVLSDLQKTIHSKYPHLEYDSFSPAFGLVDKKKVRRDIHMINQFSPHFIWIGLGAPKQEIFMREHIKHFSGGILVGVGAGFDYLAGHLKRAPIWMQNSGLEWLFRLFQEPQRLWKRYLITNALFIGYAFSTLINPKKK
jgi:N-acetylglucosaminyldiphosphoundecaprenol N-acetyl-beta-D-mannosaminyltransferase